MNALFDQAGGLKQSLPNSLPNPLAAGADATSLQQALLIEGTDDLLVAEPDPFAQVEFPISASTPQLTAPIGVRDRLRLARQLVVAEAARLAPTVSLGDGLTVQVPIINPENGELADFNPFVDATPSGRAIGVVAQQAGGGGSLLDRAVDHLGDIAGGVLAFSKDVAGFIVANPVARTVLTVVAYAVTAAACSSAAALACGLLAPATVGLLAADGVLNLSSAVSSIATDCPAGRLAGCALNLAYAAFAVAEIAQALTLAGPSAAVGRAAFAMRGTSGVTRAIAQGRLGEALTVLSELMIGSKVLGAQRAIEAGPNGEKVIADLVVRRFRDRIARSGVRTLVESKYGPAARFTPNQASYYGCLVGQGYGLAVRHWRAGPAGGITASGLACAL